MKTIVLLACLLGVATAQVIPCVWGATGVELGHHDHVGNVACTTADCPVVVKSYTSVANVGALGEVVWSKNAYLQTDGTVHVAALDDLTMPARLSEIPAVTIETAYSTDYWDGALVAANAARQNFPAMPMVDGALGTVEPTQPSEATDLDVYRSRTIGDFTEYDSRIWRTVRLLPRATLNIQIPATWDWIANDEFTLWFSKFTTEPDAVINLTGNMPSPDPVTGPYYITIRVDGEVWIDHRFRITGAQENVYIRIVSENEDIFVENDHDQHGDYGLHNDDHLNGVLHPLNGKTPLWLYAVGSGALIEIGHDHRYTGGAWAFAGDVKIHNRVTMDCTNQNA